MQSLPYYLRLLYLETANILSASECDLIISDTAAPDIDLIAKAVERAGNSVRDGRTSYTSLPETEE